MIKKEISLNLYDFPKELHPYIQGHILYDSSCHSNAKVFYSDAGVYIKVDQKGTLQKEAELTHLFYEKGLGVECLCYISLDKDYLVTKAAVGEDATHWKGTPEKLCQILASTLLTLHHQPLISMPVSLSYEQYIKSSIAYHSDSYDESYILSKYPVHNKEEAWKIIQDNKHHLKVDTLIHGDFCLPNIIINNEKFSTLIDFSQSGLGDKHIDLYWAIWSLQYNLKTDQYTDYFLDCYGRENFDEYMLKVIAAFEVFG